MDLIVIPYEYSPCTLKTFLINGKEAEQDDFGHGKDLNPECASPFCCACWMYKSDKRKARTAMKKYNITKEEFLDICNILEKTLDVGECGYCE